MLKRILILLIVSALSVSAKCDTIDFWHVYYNNIRKIECSIPDYCTFSFLKDSVKSKDSIVIHYYMDARCYDCLETLTVKDDHGREVYSITAEEARPFSQFAIPVNTLMESGFHNFDLYFRRSEKDKEVKILKISID